jgi:hypothetical protein
MQLASLVRSLSILTLEVQGYPNPLTSSARLIYGRIIIGRNECMVTRDARLKDFITDGYPSSGLPVQVLAEDHVGTYILPFSCERINGEWRNSTTGETVQANILGWCEVQTGSRGRTPPAQQPTKTQDG